jgi:hypothetical protein
MGTTIFGNDNKNSIGLGFNSSNTGLSDLGQYLDLDLGKSAVSKAIPSTSNVFGNSDYSWYNNSPTESFSPMPAGGPLDMTNPTNIQNANNTAIVADIVNNMNYNGTGMSKYDMERLIDDPDNYIGSGSLGGGGGPGTETTDWNKVFNMKGAAGFGLGLTQLGVGLWMDKGDRAKTKAETKYYNAGTTDIYDKMARKDRRVKANDAAFSRNV